ncbi:MAG TPA: hypothetical protein DEQ09_09455, partial [Bacteroidales bacterium]|nr:hypothetical protein [Bacteroidales bacterium]
MSKKIINMFILRILLLESDAGDFIIHYSNLSVSDGLRFASRNVAILIDRIPIKRVINPPAIISQILIPTLYSKLVSQFLIINIVRG